MRDCNVVLHLAALVSIPFSYHSPETFVDTNILGTLNVVHAARDQGLCRQLVTWCIDRAQRDGAGHLGLHTSEAMTKARLLYERMGFVVDGDLPATFGLRYWRYRLDL